MQVKSSSSTPQLGDAQPVPAGDPEVPENPEVPEILFEHSGWGLYTSSPDPGTRIAWSTAVASGQVWSHGQLRRSLLPKPEADVLTHIGCDCDYSNWHMAVYIWTSYNPKGTCFRCSECGEIMPVDAYEFFQKAYNLVNLT